MKKYEFLKSGKELKGADKYRYSQGAENSKLKDLAGKTITVNNWALIAQKEVDESTGEVEDEKILLAIEDINGFVAVTNSATAREAFSNIVGFLADDGVTEKFDVKVITGKSKNDREFVTLTL